MKWTTIVLLAVASHSSAALDDGVSTGSTLVYGLMMDACEAKSQSAFPNLNPLIPSRRMASVVFAKGATVVASIRPKCSEIWRAGHGNWVSGCIALSAAMASSTVRWSDCEL